MKFIAAASALVFAATALAAPTDPHPPTTPPPPTTEVCPNNNKQVCCTGLLTCLVQVLGGPCDNDVFCCKTEAPVGAFINIALLNCIDIL